MCFGLVENKAKDLDIKKSLKIKGFRTPEAVLDPSQKIDAFSANSANYLFESTKYENKKLEKHLHKSILYR